MSLLRNRFCDKIADYRILGVLALFFFTAPVVMALRKSSAHAQAPPARPGPVASKNTPGGPEETAPAAGAERGGRAGSSRALRLEGLMPAPDFSDVPVEVPGDFFTDLSAAFEVGAESGLVRCRTEDEMRLFGLWREALNGRRITENLTLRRIEQHPDGIEQYEIAIQGTGIQGWITFKLYQNRWYVVGVKQKKREKTETEADEELNRLLETLKLHGSTEDLRGPRVPRPPEER